MGVSLNWLLPKALRSEKLFFESPLSPEELMHLMQREFHRPVHSKEEQRLLGEFATDRFKVWSSSHLNETDEGRRLVPSVLLEGIVARSNVGSVVHVMLRPHWSQFVVVIMILAIAISALHFQGLDWNSILLVVILVLLVLALRTTAKNKSQLKALFAQCFDLNEVVGPADVRSEQRQV